MDPLSYGLLAAALGLLALGALVFVALRQIQRTGEVRAALDETQARLAGIVDAAMDAIITIDESQRIVQFNRAAEAVFRCPKDRALGAPLGDFLPARFRAFHGRHIEQFGRTGTTNRRMGENTVLWGLRADGEEFPVEASISQVSEHGSRFFTVILRDITLRVKAERELQELSARVLDAREDEKTRIARELHDELGQMLTALKMDLSWLRQRLPAELDAKSKSMDATLDDTIGAVRRISSDLRPLMLDDLGLAAAADWLVQDFAKRSGIDCTLDKPADADLAGLDRGVATAVYRALQESLTNIARHAQARHAWVVLSRTGGELRLEVEDDGRGIAPDELAKTRSLGLKGMRERVTFLSGSLEVARTPRGGTRLRMRVPA